MYYVLLAMEIYYEAVTVEIIVYWLHHSPHFTPVQLHIYVMINSIGV